MTEEQAAQLKAFVTEGYRLFKRLPDNAPDWNLENPDPPVYLWKDQQAVALYADGATKEFIPVFKPLPPYKGPPMMD